MMAEPDADMVIIHGNPWKWADLADAVADCRGATWTKQRWQPRPALVHRSGGRTSLYVGQRYDSAKVDLVPDGWTHDHCEVCWWELLETDEAAHGVGYTDGRAWLCSECYERFVAAGSSPPGADPV